VAAADSGPDASGPDASGLDIEAELPVGVD
jgi:hypothetical protein